MFSMFRGDVDPPGHPRINLRFSVIFQWILENKLSWFRIYIRLFRQRKNIGASGTDGIFWRRHSRGEWDWAVWKTQSIQFESSIKDHVQMDTEIVEISSEKRDILINLDQWSKSL
jgi:hypothetical protein